MVACKEGQKLSIQLVEVVKDRKHNILYRAVEGHRTACVKAPSLRNQEITFSTAFKARSTTLQML